MSQATAPMPGNALSAPATRIRTRLLGVRARLRWLGVLALIAPCAVVVVSDLARREARVAQFDTLHRLAYLGAMLESALVWGALLYGAARRRGFTRWLCASLFVIAFTFAVGGQTYFFQQYNAYLNIDVSLFASNFKDSVLNQLYADLGNYLRAKLPPLTLALFLIALARRTLRPGRRAARRLAVLAPCLLVASFFIPAQHRALQAATPDVLYLHAIGGLIRTQLGFTEQSNLMRPRARSSLPVPPLTRAPALPERNVLFVILESVRADSVCIEHDPRCEKTATSNRLLPERFPFTQMRSMDSCTAISLAVLWSGLLPLASRDELHTWPLIFDYAKAAGYDTAFWTSQNMLFGNARLWVKNLGARLFTSATQLDPGSDLDMGAPEGLLAAHVNEHFSELREPFMAVIQLSNVHYPYYVDPAGPMPFEPWTTSKAPEDNPHFKNYYQNSVYQQDQHLARMLRHVRESAAGPRTVIVYTSDHGEAFREHGQMGHTFSIFDEEVHVPMWIDAPPGTLTENEVAALRSKRDVQLFHIDLVPTVLDLIGIADAPGIAPYRTKLLGHSLLRRELTVAPLPMSNCSDVWSCAFENWGYMQGSRKLEARSWDTGWKCFDVARDPLEQSLLPDGACADLVTLAQRNFRRLPGEGIPRE